MQTQVSSAMKPSEEQSRRQSLARRVLGLVLVLAIVGICAGTAFRFIVPAPWNNYLATESSPLTLFDDPGLDFTIGYPMTWQAISTPHGMIADTPEGKSNDPRVKAFIGAPFGATLAISVDENQSPTSLQEIASERKELFQTETGFQIVSSKEAKVDGTPALAVEYIWNEQSPLLGQVRTHSLEVYVVRSRKVYILRFFGLEPNYDEKLFLKMVHSMTFRAK